jgi:hypothetical protein
LRWRREFFLCVCGEYKKKKEEERRRRRRRRGRWTCGGFKAVLPVVADRWSCCGGRRWLFSSLCKGMSLCFFFLLLIDTPFSIFLFAKSVFDAIFSVAVERKNNGGSPFSFLLPL